MATSNTLLVIVVSLGCFFFIFLTLLATEFALIRIFTKRKRHLPSLRVVNSYKEAPGQSTVEGNSVTTDLNISYGEVSGNKLVRDSNEALGAVEGTDAMYEVSHPPGNVATTSPAVCEAPLLLFQRGNQDETVEEHFLTTENSAYGKIKRKFV